MFRRLKMVLKAASQTLVKIIFELATRSSTISLCARLPLMDGLQPQCRLRSLPQEIWDMVIDYLVLEGPLFQSDHSKQEAGKGAQALLNLSCTCSLYRRALTPYLFRDVLLRTQPKSLASVLHVSQTPLWAKVKTLTVVVSVTYPGDNDLPHMVNVIPPASPSGGWRDLRLAQLSTLLSNLPPHMIGLNLELAYDCRIYNKNGTPNHRARDDYSRLVLTILETISKSFAAHESRFVVRLRTRPASGLLCLLKAPNDNGMSLHFVNGMKSFKQDALALFFDQLLSMVPTLEICGNTMCPMVRYGEQHDDSKHSALPGTNSTSTRVGIPPFDRGFRLRELRQLTLSAVGFDNDTMWFLQRNVPDIDHLTLLNCAVHNITSWGHLLQAILSSARYLRTLRLGFDYHDGPIVKDVGVESGCTDQGEPSTGPSDKELRILQREYDKDLPDNVRPLPYMVKRAPLMRGFKLNARPMRSRSDHEALLRLDETMKSRGGQGVVYVWEPDRSLESSS